MKIPFFPNTGDGTHCFQAALRMALGALVPERDYSYEELDRISGKRPGKWTWPTAAMVWMIEQGLEVRLIEDFDYADFAGRGGDYLIERFGEEVGRAQMENSDIEFERPIARRFAAHAPVERRPAELIDIERELDAGAAVIVNLNAAPLYGREGYSGHFVVICEVGRGEVRLHDPGLPPSPDLLVSEETFLKAWGYPTARDRNLMSIRRPEGVSLKG